MAAERRAHDLPLPGGSFRLFVTRLSVQTMFSMGLIENPITGTREVNLDSTRMLLDDLEMLRKKTEGNLDDDEREHLEKALRDLRHAFAELDL